jgi:hypothetical protein
MLATVILVTTYSFRMLNLSPLPSCARYGNFIKLFYFPCLDVIFDTPSNFNPPAVNTHNSLCMWREYVCGLSKSCVGSDSSLQRLIGVYYAEHSVELFVLQLIHTSERPEKLVFGEIGKRIHLNRTLPVFSQDSCFLELFTVGKS